MSKFTFAVMMVGAVFVLFRPTAASADPAQEKLKVLWDQYQHVTSIHCRGRKTENFAPSTDVATGSFEFWASAGKYRMLEMMDPEKAPDMSVDCRWDGHLWQLYSPSNGTLVISKRSDRPNSGVSQPVPFLPFEFLSPGGANAGKRLTLDQIRDPKTLARLSKVHATDASGSTAEFPGDKFLDFDSKWLITFGGEPTFLPTRIVRILTNGVAIEDSKLSYMAVDSAAGKLYFPRKVDSASRSAFGKPMGEGTSDVEVMEVNVPIPAETFVMDFQIAKQVVDLEQVDARGATTRNAEKPTTPPAPNAPPPVHFVWSSWAIVELIVAIALAIIALILVTAAIRKRKSTR